MPLKFNDEKEFSHNDTPNPPPILNAESEAGAAKPHGPGNRVNFDFAPVGPGNPKYLTGPPLAEMNSIPYRGSGMAGHGLDIDARTIEDWENHASPQESEGGNDGQEWAQWVEPTPLLVSVVDMPLETEERRSRIVPLLSATEPYTFTAVGVFDNNPVRTVLPKDDTRTAARIYVSPSPQFAAGSGNGAQYGFLVSNDQQCLTGILLGVNVVGASSVININGKSPVFVRIVPLAAYDSTKANNYSLVAITETSVLGLKRTQ
jgi:hypothetical protein